MRTEQNKIVLNADEVYYFEKRQTGVHNFLGNLSAMLTEYCITRKNSLAISDEPLFSLYKTKEGNWYEPDEPHQHADIILRRYIKTTIDAMEIAYVELRS
ncbi:hypothetical protein QTN47_07030 [Danxiaibacter flavus]|uniref:Uncharacterized protein n=1 Tax=Danxiaibacter flavus TaxID=3049108 RepID=A0ABV3ZDU8_9BACT|nr:hypothetical protein QNM32_07030 [Chitinophagaceae bacterium DXS]